MNSHYKNALIDTIDDMYGIERVNYTKELATAFVMVLAIVALSALVIAISLV